MIHVNLSQREKKMRKAQRHLLIKQVIEEFPIRTQEELLNKLGHYGVTATQATISRDIRDLKS